MNWYVQSQQARKIPNYSGPISIFDLSDEQRIARRERFKKDGLVPIKAGGIGTIFVTQEEATKVSRVHWIGISHMTVYVLGIWQSYKVNSVMDGRKMVGDLMSELLDLNESSEEAKENIISACMDMGISDGFISSITDEIS